MPTTTRGPSTIRTGDIMTKRMREAGSTRMFSLTPLDKALVMGPGVPTSTTRSPQASTSLRGTGKMTVHDIGTCRLQRLAVALGVLVFCSCSTENGPITNAPAVGVTRPYLPDVEIRGSDGDGSVAWVIDQAVAALRQNAYTCYDDGRRFPNGMTVEGLNYSIGSGETATKIKIIAVDGEIIAQRVHYTDEAGVRRVIVTGDGRPLVGADSIADRLFGAAWAAPCSNGAPS